MTSSVGCVSKFAKKTGARPDVTRDEYALFRRVWKRSALVATTPGAPARWLIVGSSTPLREGLLRVCAAREDTYILVDLPARVDESAAAREHSERELRQQLERLCEETAFTGALIVSAQDDGPSPESARPAQAALICSCAAALADLCVRGLLRRWFVVAARMFADRAVDGQADATAAALAGLVGWVNATVREPCGSAIDVSNEISARELEAVFAELHCESPGSAVSVCGAERRVPHNEPVVDAFDEDRPFDGGQALPAGEREFFLNLAEVGNRISVELRATERYPVPPGHVEIEVLFSSLECAVMPEHPESARRLGYAYAGRISRLGEGVSGGLAVGDQVVALAAHRPSRHVITAAGLVAPVEGSDLATAVTWCAAHVAARIALEEVARARAGDNVLVLGAGSLTGLACIQRAKALGASIAAEERDAGARQWLKARGITRVLTGASETFQSDLLQMPRGERIRVVVNCGTSAVPDLSACTAPGATVIELFPRRQSSLVSNVSYHEVDIFSLLQKHPHTFSRWLYAAANELRNAAWPSAEVVEVERAGTVFGVPQLDFRRSVLDWRAAESAPVKPLARSGGEIRPDATYVVANAGTHTALCVARWLVAQGAGHIVLVGSQDPTLTVKLELNFLKRAGANVRWVRVDSAAGVDLSQQMRALPAIAGVIYVAGSSDDRTLGAVTGPTLSRAFARHVDSIQRLVAASAGASLEFFVCLGGLAENSRLGAVQSITEAYLEATFREALSARVHASFVRFPAWAEVDVRKSLVPLAAEDAARIAPRAACSLLGRGLRNPNCVRADVLSSGPCGTEDRKRDHSGGSVRQAISPATSDCEP